MGVGKAIKYTCTGREPEQAEALGMMRIKANRRYKVAAMMKVTTALMALEVRMDRLLIKFSLKARKTNQFAGLLYPVFVVSLATHEINLQCFMMPPRKDLGFFLDGLIKASLLRWLWLSASLYYKELFDGWFAVLRINQSHQRSATFLRSERVAPNQNQE